MNIRFFLLSFLFLNQNLYAIDFSGFKSSVSSLLTLPNIVGVSVAVVFVYSLVRNPEIVVRCAEPVVKTTANVVEAGIQTVVGNPIKTALVFGYSGYLKVSNEKLKKENNQLKKDIENKNNKLKLLETVTSLQASDLKIAEGLYEDRQKRLEALVSSRAFKCGSGANQRYFISVAAQEYESRLSLIRESSVVTRVPSAISGISTLPTTPTTPVRRIARGDLV